MGKGLIPADPETWKVRRRAIVPGFHKAWYNTMCKTFVKCNKPLVGSPRSTSYFSTSVMYMYSHSLSRQINWNKRRKMALC